jgi:hypothetical protein
MMDTADRIDPNQLCLTPDIDVPISVLLVCQGLFLAGKFVRPSICERSMEQDCKSRALPLVAPSDSQFTADPFDKRPDDGHSHGRRDGKSACRAASLRPFSFPAQTYIRAVGWWPTFSWF